MEGSVVQWKEQSSYVTLNKSFNLSAPQTIKMESAYHRRLSDPERGCFSVCNKEVVHSTLSFHRSSFRTF